MMWLEFEVLFKHDTAPIEWQTCAIQMDHVIAIVPHTEGCTQLVCAGEHGASWVVKGSYADNTARLLGRLMQEEKT